MLTHLSNCKSGTKGSTPEAVETIKCALELKEINKIDFEKVKAYEKAKLEKKHKAFISMRISKINAIKVE